MIEVCERIGEKYMVLKTKKIFIYSRRNSDLDEENDGM